MGKILKGNISLVFHGNADIEQTQNVVNLIITKHKKIEILQLQAKFETDSVLFKIYNGSEIPLITGGFEQ